MTCDFSHDDGAYVLGALSPAERLAFKRHLADCPECTRDVAELADLPGLLGRVGPDVLEGPLDEPVPDLLPALVREVRRSHRRRGLVTAGLAAAAAAVVVVVPVGLAQLGDEPTRTADPGSSATPSPVEPRRMEPVDGAPVHATLSLEEVTWGTRLGLSCTYDPEQSDQDLPHEADYVLFVRTRSGRLEQVGSWRAVGGRSMQIMAATAATAAELRSVEVRTTDGRVVLQLTT